MDNCSACEPPLGDVIMYLHFSELVPIVKRGSIPDFYTCRALQSRSLQNHPNIAFHFRTMSTFAGTDSEFKASLSHGKPSFRVFMVGKASPDSEPVKHLIGDKELTLPGDESVVVSEALIPPEAIFREDFYFAKLHTVRFGRLCLWSPCLPSTQTLLSRNFHKFPLGTVCIADRQSHGKGRAGNEWMSPPGCLMFSFTLQMDNGRVLPFLQYVATLAMVETIDLLCLEKALPVPEVKIKWPNDLYANGLKIGGVLCSSTYHEKKFDVVVGIGLNVMNQEPTTCLDDLLRELAGGTPSLTKEELVAAFFCRFEKLFDLLNNQGFSPLETDYYRKWLHSGQRVVLEERSKAEAPISEVYLTIKGLTATGYLLAVDDDMEKYELHPDGNSFDFMKGLMRTKLLS